MFDIGAWEILVIGVMALVILGPERLPGAIKSTISAIRKVKEVANGFKQEVANQLDTHELHENLKKAEALGMQSIGKELQDSVDELKAAAASVQTPYKKVVASEKDPASVKDDKELPNSIGHSDVPDMSSSEANSELDTKLSTSAVQQTNKQKSKRIDNE